MPTPGGPAAPAPAAGPRTAVVTGSASGIGAACAARLAADGFRVIGVDLHHADVIADLSRPEGRASAVERVDERCDGRLDGLVTCAGIAGSPSTAGAALVSLNYFGTVALLEGLRPLLAASPAGAAVAISSNAATIQPAIPAEVCAACLEGDEARARALADRAGSLAAYPATKIAVARWVRRRAVGPDWAGSGVRLNAVAPGMIDTPMIAASRADPEIGPLLELLPLPVGRAGRAAEVAALVSLLLGPDGGFFCGSVLFVDGGTDALVRPDDWPAPLSVVTPSPSPSSSDPASPASPPSPPTPPSPD